jgi:hypothetical protein
MYFRVVKQMTTDVSEVRAASIIRAISLTTRCYITEDSELHTRRRENLKSHIYKAEYESLLGHSAV